MSTPTTPVTTPPPLHLHTRHDTPGTIVIAVTGEIDMATAPDLHTALLNAMAVHQPTAIDIDLSTCTFLDCSGLRALTAAHTTAQTSGCQIRIRHPRHLVRLVLEITGLLDMFTAPDDDNTEQTAPNHQRAIPTPRRQTQTATPPTRITPPLLAAHNPHPLHASDWPIVPQQDVR